MRTPLTCLRTARVFTGTNMGDWAVSPIVPISTTIRGIILITETRPPNVTTRFLHPLIYLYIP